LEKNVPCVGHNKKVNRKSGVNLSCGKDKRSPLPGGAGFFNSSCLGDLQEQES